MVALNAGLHTPFLGALVVSVSAAIACAPKKIAPEDLVETFETSATVSEVQEAAIGVLQGEHFSVLEGDDRMVSGERVQCRTVVTTSSSREGITSTEAHQKCDRYTVIVIAIGNVLDGTRVRVETYRAAEGYPDADVRRRTTPTTDEVHHCKTIAAKLKEALRVEEG